MKRKLRRLCDFALDLLYPARCPACGKVVGWDEYFCAECEKSLEYIDPVPWQAMFPAKIGESEPYFDCAEALFRYEGTARSAVLSFKYRMSSGLADYAAERLWEKLGSDGYDSIDVGTSVPMHFAKRLDRGYDQAELLAGAMSRVTGAGFSGKLLGHRRRKLEQHNTLGKDRYSAAESTYFIRANAADKPLSGKTVLLCDDIFTTGSTVNKCAQLLKELGAERVCAAVICLTVPEKHEDSE